MSEVRARLAPGTSAAAEDFADLTEIPVESVAFADDGRLAVTFADVLPPEVEAAVERRIVSATAREEQLRAEAETFLATPAQDLAEIDAQVKRLTEIVLGKAEV